MGGADTLTEERTEQASDDELESTGLENREEPAADATDQEKGREQEDSKDTEKVEPADLPEEWYNHPSAIEAFDKARDEGASEAQSGKDKELRKLEASMADRERLAANEALAHGVVQKLTTLVVDVRKKLTDDGMSMEAVSEQFNRIFAQYNGWALLFSETQGKRDESVGLTKGAVGAALALTQGNVSTAISKELVELQDELSDKLTINKTPGLTVETIIEQVRDRRDELLRGDATAKNEAKRENREETTERRANRGKPPADIVGRGRSTSATALTREKVEGMTAKEIKEIPLDDLDRAMRTT